ncbi:hypothetical protein B1748_28215 [Paenibacillus sp. MY03]|uniref:helix-turn-helix domain-containing protein n=1 Tax=Paenibacillus sp. MY03 TaxID=302980 RepID=UPI000B3C3F0F|nr:helix-turn-helix domain-containing protein [Paenibacillus sp. MY03]OUS70632.1 hypothetical protein B1748_28215 [Paenibacillus sp. MY03]
MMRPTRNLHYSKNLTFKHRLMLIVLLLSVIPVFVLGMFSSNNAASIVQQEVDRNHLMVLRQIQYQFDQFMKSMDRASFQIANNSIVEKSVEIGPINNDLGYTFGTIDVIKKARSMQEIHFDVSLVYMEEAQVYSTRYGFVDLTDFPFRDLLKSVGVRFNSMVVVPPETGQRAHELLMLRPVPAFYSDRPDGILVFHIDPSLLTGILEQVELGHNGKILITDEQGAVVFSQNAAEIGSRISATLEPYMFRGKAGVVSAESSREEAGKVSMNGEDYLSASIHSSYNNWSYIAITPYTELTKKAGEVRRFTLGLAGSLVGLAILMAFLGSNRLYSPIQRMQQKLQGEFREQLPYLRDSIFLQLIRGEMSDNKIRGKTERYGLLLKGSRFYVCLVEMDDFAQFKQKYKENDRSLMIYALRKMLEELCENDFSCVTVSPLPNQVAVLIGTKDASERADEAVRRKAMEFRSNSQNHFHLPVTVALSRACRDYTGISEAYQDASELIGYRMLLGSDELIVQDSVRMPLGTTGYSLIELKKKILSAMAKGDESEARSSLSALIEAIPQHMHNVESVLGTFAYLIGEFDQLVREWSDGGGELDTKELYKQLLAMSSLGETERWFADTVFPLVTNALQDANIPKRTKLIQQVLQYIHLHYDTDLGLQHVADTFQITPPQLSRLFREERNESFSDYVLRYRIEKAKEWLAHTEMPIREIAERLRYASVQNFTRIFKQMTNDPPGYYRKKSRLDE